MGKILNLIKHYKSLGLSDVTDYDKFNHLAITHHSTQLEGRYLDSQKRGRSGGGYSFVF